MSKNFSVGDHIWVKPTNHGEFEIPMGGQVVGIEAKRIKIKTETDSVVFIAHEQVVKAMHMSSVKGVEDMISLGDLQEYSILRNLKMRYAQKLIYTYTGSMLVAVNPYEVLPIYTNKQIKDYKGKKIGELPPHIFAIGDECYNNMKKTKKNQCIVISGESGAGKTESTKLILQYLPAISEKHSWIEQQILESNPILEAFGNAKTVRNDNSSRFGKYINIHFNKTFSIEGAKIDQYLLEKSRIVSQNEGERNYHIFYSMLAGLAAEEKKKLELKEAANYHYLNQGKSLTCQGRNEANEFADIRNAMKVLNFPEPDIWNIFTLLAAILHLGNLNFKATMVSNIECSEIGDSGLLGKISEFLGLPNVELGKGLTRRSFVASGEKVVKELSKEQATDTRDAFVKGIYGRIFIFLVDKINLVVNQNKTAAKACIGVLDIFGFENFKINSFEQLCINYANENLQQFFVQHIFKMEQEYYNQEGINWQNISFIDNQDVLDMIGIKPMNIMSVIDDETRFPKGTDFSMVTKLHTQHGKTEHYLKPKSDLEPIFGIKHFAGSVHYQIPGFLEKNRDSFSADLKQLVTNSRNELLKKLFEGDVHEDGAKRNFTLALQFRTSLDVLMKNLNSCHPFFVRCIKPNEEKKPQIFDSSLCVRQLRYSGMMETAKIRQAGYPIRYTFDEFVNRFRILGTNIPPAHKGHTKESSKKICEKAFQNGEDFQIGNTRIFLKENDSQLLEEERTKVFAKYVVVLQSRIKGWLCRRRYLRMKEAALVMQKTWRGRGYRARFLRIRRGYHRLPAVIRARYLTHEYKTMKKRIAKLQAVLKGRYVRKHGKFGKIHEAVVLRHEEEKRLKKAGNKNYKQIAEMNMQKRLAELSMQYQLKEGEVQDDEQASQLVDDVFGYLNSPDTLKTPDYTGAKDVSRKRPAPPIPKIEEDEDLSEFNFEKYASTYFSPTINAQFTKKAIKSSLHQVMPTPDDVIAAQALWMTLLRFMGDLPEPPEEVRSKVPVMMTVTETVGRSFSNRKEFQEILKQEKKMETMSKAERQRFISMTMKRKNKLLEDVKKGMVVDNQTTGTYSQWVSSRRKNFEKLHFIIAHGILRPELRDEIYCQICKQLNNNPYPPSHAKGWILLSLCVGCFPPSERFTNYLKNFINRGPPGYAPYCKERLNRTFQNGARTQPPCWLELTATKSKEPMNIQIALSDKTVHNFEVDSATTSEEVCQKIADSLGLADVVGFSLFITSCDKVMSLGSEGDHLMDAISQCEQYAKEVGKSEKSMPWRLFFRKEIFMPWHNAESDPTATNLIYHQIISGLRHGEYRCAEGDVAVLIAQQYYVENGAKLNDDALSSRIGEYIPVYMVQRENLQEWQKKITNAFVQSSSVKNKKPPLKVKEDVVKYAKFTWPILFSKFFEAKQSGGPELTKNNATIIVAVNWTGFFLVDDQEQILLELTFAEISFISYEVKSRSMLHNFTLNTINGDEYVFQSPDAKSLHDLVAGIIDGLKRRSKFVVAVQDYKHPTDSPSFLALKRGDLITLKNDLTGDALMTASWGYGECNDKSGDFPTEHIHILPTTSKPPGVILAAFKKEGAFDRKQTKSMLSTIQRMKLYTLKSYADEHFRTGRRMTARRISVLAAARRNSQEELWKYTNEPIRQPHLQKLLEDVQISKEAVDIFSDVLKYMGDLPSAKSKVSNEYTDLIFTGPLKSDLLKDEVYCQIMRQLTFNRLSQSEERGWDLMYLATGLFVPSPGLLLELNKFLKSRTHPVAEICIDRLTLTQKVGPRKYPPYSVEVESIVHRTVQVFHKVYFPDDSEDAFEAGSLSTASDICKSIVDRLGMSTSDGFSLFVIISDRAFAIPSHVFFYDFLHEVFDWFKQTRPSWNSAAPMQIPYQIFFMKKLWANTTPGKDLIADTIFHYHQEEPKYLRGYHKSSLQEVITIAALILRIKFGTNFDSKLFPSNVKDLVPLDMVKIKSSSDWKKLITAAYKNDGDLSVEDAKVKFLKIIYEFPTFGSAFFEVKQTSEKNYPDFVNIAVNKNGVHVIHPRTKDILITYDFAELNNWSSGNTFFHLTVGNIMRKTKCLWETTQGYKIDDLLASYADYFDKPPEKQETFVF